MSEMAEKIHTLWPELALTVTAFAVMIVGLSPSEAIRRATYPATAVGLLVSIVLAAASGAMGVEGVPPMALFAKVALAAVGLVMLMALAEQPTERSVGRFDPGNTLRGEFYGFFLLSLTGAMLCAGADDLIWMFLALELTSLPTYVMVATSRNSLRASEAAVKYFFLGALSAAVFLYGFALLYGATGSTYLSEIQGVLADQIASDEGLSGLALTGLVLTVLGLCFKIAAVPMHFYVADVYQGAAASVSGFLAFVPKAAGFFSLILVLSTVGWPLGPDRVPALDAVIWALAALTMFVGNTLALMQSSVKRVLAYSSIAHSGYMMVALLAGPSVDSGLLAGNGVSAILFYLVAYGLMNLGAFAVLGMLRRAGEEAETYDDLRGLAKRHPGLAAALAICVLSLLGFPPLVGFWGKLMLVSVAVGAGHLALAVLLVINSAVAAYYYLRIVAECYLPEREGESVSVAPLPSRALAAWVAAGAVIILSFASAPLITASHEAANGLGTRARMAPLPPGQAVGGDPAPVRPATTGATAQAVSR